MEDGNIMVHPYGTVLIYVFAVFQEVSLFTIRDCGSYSCLNSFCCSGTCCSMPPEPEFDNSPFVNSPFFIVITVFFGVFLFCVLMIIFKAFCNMCKKSGEPQLEERTRNQPIPHPLPFPGPTAPPAIQASNPPPYSEVVGQPNFYPAPMGQPPCYENIAMEDLSRELSFQDQGPRIISERPSDSSAFR